MKTLQLNIKNTFSRIQLFSTKSSKFEKPQKNAIEDASLKREYLMKIKFVKYFVVKFWNLVNATICTKMFIKINTSTILQHDNHQFTYSQAPLSASKKLYFALLSSFSSIVRSFDLSSQTPSVCHLYPVVWNLLVQRILDHVILESKMDDSLVSISRSAIVESLLMEEDLTDIDKYNEAASFLLIFAFDGNKMFCNGFE